MTRQSKEFRGRGWTRDDAAADAQRQIEMATAGGVVTFSEFKRSQKIEGQHVFDVLVEWVR